MPQQPLGNTSISNTWYQDCNKLPLDRYIDCLLDNDLSQLILTGTVPEKQLQETWDKIYVQSLQLGQSNTYNEVFEIMKDINDLRAKITIVNNIIEYLQMKFDQDLVNLLNIFALRCDLVETDIDDVLISKLNLVVARMKKWFPQLSIKEKELEELRLKNTNTIDRNYFDDCLEAISDAKGHHIRASEITVSRFYRSLIKVNDAAIKKINDANRKNR